MVSARELRAEARAWRRAARAIDADRFVTGFTVTRAMQERSNAHWHATTVRLPYLTWWLGHGRVLACLFLALECEDEARALGRGGR